jgi:hypothetical protein
MANHGIKKRYVQANISMKKPDALLAKNKGADRAAPSMKK